MMTVSKELINGKEFPNKISEFETRKQIVRKIVTNITVL